MSDFVKQFIENNIEEIDAGNWTDVISSWYAESVQLFTYTDAWLDEFQYAMNVIGVDIVAESKSVREDYMYNLLQQYIEAYLDYRTPIKKSSILNSLASKLWFSDWEILKIMDKAVEESDFNLEVDFDEYYTA